MPPTSALNGGPTHSRASSFASNFNPQQINVDIRTPEELAAVNNFLITLGRDVTGGSDPRGSIPSIKQESGHGSMSNEGLFFDQNSLAQLGLSGMPGIDWTVD
ncbi:hypothetical protein M422DRAFT_188568, partial [Sphaerobolus stellatus SS14]